MNIRVCTDVAVRAVRAGLDLNLQNLVHEDMKRDFDTYPQNWVLESPDNIGAGAKEEDRLFEFKITAHYRIKQIEYGGMIYQQDNLTTLYSIRE